MLIVDSVPFKMRRPRNETLPRRTFLRGIGASIALPFLDAMTPAFAAGPAESRRAA